MRLLLRFLRPVIGGCCLLLTLLSAQAGSGEKLVYSFRGGSDGTGPVGTLNSDDSGNLYGTTLGGGGTECEGGAGCGTVFKLSPGGTETVLYAFAGGSDGALPSGGLTSDGAGSFYGTTTIGGGADNDGTVFTVAPDGTESVFYAFRGGNDGVGPVGPLTLDDNGNLYGNTVLGGNGNGCSSVGCGTVFKITPTGSETVLHQFQGGSDGAEPFGNLVRDGSGDLYGTTSIGGYNGSNCPNGSIGCGTVFKVAPDGTETVLHAFQAGTDGFAPIAGLLTDQAGNLYGTTEGGGGAASCPFGSLGCGIVFKLATDGTETVLYAFKGGSDGQFPEATLIADTAGNLYGTTFGGGGKQCIHYSGCGTVFKLTPEGKEKVLYSFKKARGAQPVAGLLLGSNGTLSGTAANGGKFKDGVVFSLKK